MYKAHFGFRERPFQLVPNPAFLFLSKTHEEALAHLNYAIAQGDGFVEITGEVGTGKTTLCRAFIDSLDAGTETAYIFNPKLDADELLEAVHDEFGIPYQAGMRTKTLIDSLNAFLMEKKAQGKKVLLIIDEAQNLSKEVLEQIRLLSNLETHTEKLLQIVLVGQPELGRMLDSYALRQLGQRITLSAYLAPLTRKETIRYIRHRLHIAAQGAQVHFTPGAFRKIFKYTRGIPRKIHIVCDRALLVAYVLDQSQIAARTVGTAIRELAGRGEGNRGGQRGALMPVVGGFFCLAVLVFLGGRSGMFPFPELPGEIQPARILSPVGPPPLSQPPETSFVSPTDSPVAIPYAGRYDAVKVALSLWNLTVDIHTDMPEIRKDIEYFKSFAEKNGFELYPVQGSLGLLRELNLPAIFTFYVAGTDALKYLTLSRIDDTSLTFLGADSNAPIMMSAETLAARWSGVAYVPWKNFLHCRGTIPLAASKQSVLVLKQLLRDIGFENIEPGPAYDDTVRGAVKTIQKKYGLPVDGLVGSLTKILLYNEQGVFDIPHLRQCRKLEQ